MRPKPLGSTEDRHERPPQAPQEGHALGKCSGAMLWAGTWLRRYRAPAVLAAAALVAGPVVGVVAAVSVNYIQIDRNGPPKAWGKGAGDLNGDGKADVVVGSVVGGLYWYQNPGWTKRVISSGTRTQEDLEVVDLDKDGRRDVVAVTTNAVTWFKNGGNGNSWSARTLVSGRDLHDLEIADFDGDGKLDLVGRDQYAQGETLFLWRQVSPTSWTASTIPNIEAGTGLVAADLNRDGKIDIATNKYWFRNRSTNGSFAFDKILYNANAERDGYVAAGRIDGDANVDLLVTPAHPTVGGTHNVAWYRNPGSGNGTWARTVIEGGVQPVVHFAAIADFNDDGRNDIVTAMTQLSSNPKIKIYFNRADNGSFGAPEIVANASSHMMQIIDVAGKRSLFGADYNDAGSTSIDLWQIGGSPTNPPPAGPAAVDDAAVTDAGQAVTIRVLANDSGTGLGVASVTSPGHGTARVTNNSNAVIYTPAGGFTGTDTFRYTLRDGNNRNSSATVSVTVRGTASSDPVYLGCFKDQGTIGSTNGRDLNGFLLADRTGMTQALCNRTCGDRGYRFAGTQSGYQCFCGNRYGTFGSASNCTTPCTGANGKKCGGTWANSVFDLR